MRLVKAESEIENIRKQVNGIETKNEKQSEKINTHDRKISVLETTLLDFTHTMQAVVEELKIVSTQNKKMIDNMNLRLKSVEDGFIELKKSLEEKKSSFHWAFSIVIPALVASGIEFINLLFSLKH